jgi:hypothetical protein
MQSTLTMQDANIHQPLSELADKKKVHIKKPPKCKALERQVFVESVDRKRQQGDGTCALDGFGQLTLMLGAIAAHTAGQNLAALIGETAKTVDVFVIDEFDFIHTKGAHFPAGFASPRAGPFLATILRHG